MQKKENIHVDDIYFLYFIGASLLCTMIEMTAKKEVPSQEIHRMNKAIAVLRVSVEIFMSAIKDKNEFCCIEINSQIALILQHFFELLDWVSENAVKKMDQKFLEIVKVERDSLENIKRRLDNTVEITQKGLKLRFYLDREKIFL